MHFFRSTSLAALALLLLAAPLHAVTYGETTDLGGSSSHGQGTLLGSRITVPAPMTMTGFSVLYRTAGQTAQFGLYAESGGEPAALVAQTGVFTVPGTGWQTQPTTAAVTLPAGSYWMMGVYGSNASVGIVHSQGGTVKYRGQSATAALPNPIGTVATYSGQRFNYAITGTDGGQTTQAPAVTLTGVSDICLNGAKLAGTVNPGGAQTTATFQYRTSPMAAWSNSTSVLVPAGSSAVPVSVTLTEALQPSTGYEWRLVAVNSAGTRETQPGSFMTAPNGNPTAEVAAGTRLSAKPPGTITIPLSATDPDEACGDSIVRYEWDLNNDRQPDVTQSSPEFELTAARRAEFGINEQGVKYTLGFAVTDEYGGTGAGETEIEIELVDPRTSVLFSKGDAVPGAGETGSGIPPGTTWVSFGVPSLNEAGDVALLGTTTGMEAAARGKKLFVGNLPFSATDRRLAVAAAVGGAAPGTAAGVKFASFKDPLLNAGGDIAFLATLSGGGVTSVDNQGIYVALADVLGIDAQLVARKGAQPPGMPAGVQWKAFTSLALGQSTADGSTNQWPLLAFTGTMVHGSSGIANITAANDSGLWIVFDDGTGPWKRLALQEGQRFYIGETEKTVRSFIALKAAPGAPGQGSGVSDGGVLAQLSFTDGMRALVRISRTLGDTGTHEVGYAVVAETGDAIPGLTERVASFGVPSQSASGEATAWVSRLTGTLNNVAVLASQTDGTLAVLARKGDAANSSTNGDGLILGNLLTVVVNHEKQALIMATLAGTDVTAANNSALIGYNLGDTGTHEILAREGSQPPGVERGSQWATFPSSAVGEGGYGAAFVGKMKSGPPGAPGPGGVTTAIDQGLWATGSDGTLRLLLREGQPLGERTVRTFTVLSMVAGSPTQGRSFAAGGTLLVRVIDTLGAQHLVQVRLP